MRYRKPHRVRRKKAIIKNSSIPFFVFGFIILSSLIYFLFFSDFFEIKEIIVLGSRKVAEKEIRAVIENEFLKKTTIFPGENIFLVNLKEVEKRILDTFFQISEVKIKRNLPQRLVFTILEREEKAMFCRNYELFTKDNSETFFRKCFLIDQEGIAFEEILRDNDNLAKIKRPDFKEELGLGQKAIDAELLSKILIIFSGLENLSIKTKEIIIVSDERINVATADGWDIYFDPKRDLDWQMTKLKVDLEKNIPPERKGELEYIELRFGNLAPFKYKKLSE